MSSSISHIGVVVRDLERATREWCDRYGMNVVNTVDSESEGVRSNFISFADARAEATCIELIEPLDKEDLANPIARRLAKRGEGFLQIAFSVDDVKAAGERLRDDGIGAVDAQPFIEGAGPRVIVLPDDANGTVLELLEWGNV
ncbi:VOC family protein [Sinomonas humi]|uniref:VOC domain-containing protein n=1 Tax=Sinomonas humi TaxID=1338436 RepID=A0A0B2AG10_9MICC|nr:VOC family protein [Sinomonas humi]KHL02469.1 hypothetical protein LK10_12825 [Sinomonas humi]